MEDLLLVFDEIDDLFAMVGLLWHSILSFALAVAAFLLTGYAALRMPLLVASIGIAMLALGGLDALRARRLAPSMET